MFRIIVLKSALAVLTALCITGSYAAAGDDEKKEKIWIVDLEKAKSLAAEKNLDILMEFTGSDWCPPCIAMQKAVFDKEVFKETTPKHFVLLKLDSPRDKSKQSPAEIKQYRRLADQYNITGVPTILLADADGRPYAKKGGYNRALNAQQYVDFFVKTRNVRKYRDKLFAAAKKEKGIARAKLLAAAFDKIDEELIVSVYRETLDEIIKLDSDNKAKLRNRYMAMIQLSDVNQALTKIRRGARADLKTAIKQLDQLVKSKKLEGRPLQESLYTKASLLFRTDRAAAQKLLEQSAAAAPKTERAEQIRSILARVFKSEVKPK